MKQMILWKNSGVYSEEVLGTEEEFLAIEEFYSKEWWLNGERHRENGPAKVWSSGDQAWYRNGKFHRDGGPAIIWSNGYQEWYKNGLLHREDGPAIIRYEIESYYFFQGSNFFHYFPVPSLYEARK